MTLAHETVEEMRRLAGRLEEAQSGLREQAIVYAEAERDYRKAKARAWLRAPEGTAAHRAAWVDGETADARMKRDMADGMRQAHLEDVRNCRQQISAWQTWINADREEAAFSRTGPDGGAY